MTRNVVCLQGLCSKAECPYLHVNLDPAAPVCEAFLRGYCAAGASCRSKHLTRRMLRDSRPKRTLLTGAAEAAPKAQACTKPFTMLRNHSLEMQDRCLDHDQTSWCSHEARGRLGCELTDVGETCVQATKRARYFPAGEGEPPAAGERPEKVMSEQAPDAANAPETGVGLGAEGPSPWPEFVAIPDGSDSD